MHYNSRAGENDYSVRTGGGTSISITGCTFLFLFFTFCYAELKIESAIRDRWFQQVFSCSMLSLLVHPCSEKGRTCEGIKRRYGETASHHQVTVNSERQRCFKHRGYSLQSFCTKRLKAHIGKSLGREAGATETTIPCMPIILCTLSWVKSADTGWTTEKWFWNCGCSSCWWGSIWVSFTQ